MEKNPAVDWTADPANLTCIFWLGMCLISGALLAIGVLAFAGGKLAGWW